ncbi:MAG: glycosyltransferase family 39 protein [Bacillota bacterium]
MALRLVNLGNLSLDFDEIYSVKLSTMDFSGIVNATSRDFHPPLYYFILNLWTSVFGRSEFAVRIPSLTFGLFSIWAVYLIAKYIFDERTALFASFLFALSHLNVRFAQDARMYSLLVLLAVLAMFYLLKLTNEQTIKNFAWFVLLNVLLLYTHVYSFFIISAEYFYFLSLYFLDREAFKKGLPWFFHAAVIILLLFAPWIFIFSKQFLLAQKLLWIPKATFWGFFESLIEYSGSFLLSFVLLPLIVLSLFSVSIGLKKNPGALLNLLESASISFSLKNIKNNYFLLLWLLFPILLPFTISQFLSPIFLMKYTIAASVAFILLASGGYREIHIPAFRYTIIILVAAFSLLNFKNDWSVPTKERWKEAINFLDQSADQKDLIAFNAGVSRYLYDYYSNRSNIPTLSLEPGEDQLNRDSLKSLLSPYLSKYEKIWLVVSHSRDYKHEIVNTMKELTDSVSTRLFSTNNRKYFFISSFTDRSFDLYLLKSYTSPDITVYAFQKKNKSFFTQNAKQPPDKTRMSVSGAQ